MRKKEVPKGLRDLLPEEVKTKRNMEQKAARLFRSYGYEEVITPTFEFLEVIEAGTSGHMREELFLFMDREGGILSLRPEMTVSIARLAATHLQEEVFPQRLYYIANVFRHVLPQKAQYREFWQIGIELLGAAGVWADAEVITIAVRTLRELGLKDFKISLNQVGIFNSLLEDSGLLPENQELIRNLVERKDLVELSRVLEGLPIQDELKESIAVLPILHGGLEVIDRIPYLEQNRRASTAVNDLIKVYEALKVYGVIDNIVIDMGVLRGLDYYTGIVFEGYSPGLGYGLLGGGRYDNLMGQFGFDHPATGFALGMDRLALVLNSRDDEPIRFIVGGNSLEKMVSEAERLRQQGYIVEVDVEASSREELEAKLQNKNGYSLVYLDND
ncbi:ATP phosphoribosyltransferase regulatory subunit [Syntrophomonas erecta]